MKIVRALIVFVLLGVYLAPAASAQTLTRGPLIQNPAALTTTMTILWWTDVAGDSKVEYGTTTGLGSQVTVAQAASCEVGTAGTCHTVPLTGLLPGTRYYYRLLTNGTEVLATTYFQTFKATSDPSELYFTVIGDWGQGSSAQGQLGNILHADDPPLLMTVGDNAYQNGTQSDWDNNVFISQFKNQILRRAVFIPVLGNHDLNNVGAGNWANSVEIKMHALPRNAPAGQEERFFSFDYGNAHFVVLDSNPGAVSLQNSWLAADLAATTRKWKFVFLHHTPYSCANGFASIGSDHTVRDNWGPIFEQHGVDIVFDGHDHIYERSGLVDHYQIGGAGGSDGLSTRYIMTGGGGASLDSAAQVDGGGPFGQGFFHSKEYCPWLANNCSNGVNGQYCSFARFQFSEVRIVSDTTLTLKSIDNNDAVFDTLVITKGSICGNAAIEAGEQCDQGAANGSSTSCCTASCQYVTVGTSCRTVAGICDVAETCTGASGACPTNGFVSGSTVCRSAAGGCDLAESCTGSSAACPSNQFAANGAVCRPAGGVCDHGEVCTGGGAACPSDGKSTAICRPAIDDCDAVESCDGSSSDCPANGVVPGGTPCRIAGDVCDVAETCTGFGTACPPDGFASSATVCRGAGGSCDVAESCTGNDPSCPADVLVVNGTACRAATGICDVAESCSGGSATCPNDGFAANTVVCRGAVSTCDAVEKCSGSSAACPGDGFAASSTVCRAAVSTCDAVEQCTGGSNVCPSDAVASSSSVCRAALSVCDLAESCDGSTTACPSDGFASSAVTCRPATGVCDLAESCTGSSSVCPPNGFATNAVTCRPSAGVCDLAETCSGGANCPSDALQSSSVECRPTAGTCDVPEFCTGSGVGCPADTGQPDGDGDGTCDLEDVCLTVVDPGQEDGDGDGLGDACDPCTNAADVRAVKPKLSMQKLAQPIGDHRFKFSGTMTVPSAAIDPASDGVRIIFVDGAGTTIVDAAIPPGLFDALTNAGWKANSKGTTFLYKNLGGGVPLIEGVTKILIKKNTKVPGQVRFSVQARNGGYPLPASLPMRGTLILDPPYASTNQCGDALFPGPQSPACAFVAPPGTIKCK